MGVPYKLQRKKNPQKRDEAGKWYAVPKTGTPVSEKVMTRMATDDTTMADFELSASAKLIGKFIHNQAIQGKRVRIPGLGTFRVSFGSEGVEDIMNFHTGLIRNVKVVFTLDADLRASILNDLRFENAGVDDDGVYYGSLENYKQVKGLVTGGGSATTPGGGTTTTPGGGEDGDNPLG